METNNERDDNRLQEKTVPSNNAKTAEQPGNIGIKGDSKVSKNESGEVKSPGETKAHDEEKARRSDRNRNNRGRYYRNRNWKNKKKQSAQPNSEISGEEVNAEEDKKGKSVTPEIKESSETKISVTQEKSQPKLIEAKKEEQKATEKPETKNKPAHQSLNSKEEKHRSRKNQQPKQKENKPAPKPAQKNTNEKPAAQKKTPTHIPPKKNSRNKPAVKKPVKKAVPIAKKDNRSFPGIKSVSIVIPLLNEEGSLRILYNDIKKAITPYSFDYEIIFIDDGSTDTSLSILRELSRRDNKVHYFSFRKNYGKSAALNVGFKHAKGDAVITMDADLQDDPAEIPNLLRKLSEGYDLVSGWKKVRHDPFIKRHSSKFFNYMTRISSDVKIHDFNCGLKAYRKEVIKSVYVHGELHRYIPVLAGQKGFKITEIPVKHHPRRYGKTKFGISRFFKGFVDLLTILMITRYATRPLHLFGFIGTISFAGGFLIDGYLTFEWLLHKTSLSNRPLLLLGLLMMIVGVQLFAIGLLGELFVHKFRTDLDFSIKESK